MSANELSCSYNDEMNSYNREIDRIVSTGFHAPNHFVMEHTQKLCKAHSTLRGFVQRSIEMEVLYSDPKTDHYAYVKDGEPNGPTREIVFSKKRSFEAARAYLGKKIAVLNFASAVHVGGSPWTANAQEECLCRISTLYPCLEAKREDFYDVHQREIKEGKMDDMGSSDIIYTPGVIVFKTDEVAPKLLAENDWYSVDVITCAAPILRGSYDRWIYDEHMKQRIGRILSVAMANGVEVLILGAFGCGAYHNPPRIVAETFEMWLHEFRFENVEFAIFDREDRPDSNYNIFKEVFIRRGRVNVR